MVREGLWPEAEGLIAEPSLWRDGAGHFHMISEERWPVRGAGRHAYSANGVDWALAPTHAYEPALTDTNATFVSRGRPVLLEATFDTGRRLYLETTAKLEASAPARPHLQGVLGFADSWNSDN